MHFIRTFLSFPGAELEIPMSPRRILECLPHLRVRSLEMMLSKCAVAFVSVRIMEMQFHATVVELQAIFHYGRTSKASPTFASFNFSH